MRIKRFVYVGLALCAIVAAARVLPARAEGEGKAGEGAHPKQGFTGKVTAVDAANSKVTFTNKANESLTATVTGDTKVMVDGKAGTLADVKVGMFGGVKLAEDKQTALMLKADTPGQGDKHKAFTGKFTAVDADHSTVTLTNKKGESHTFTINADTKIRVNGKPGTLADVKVDMYGGVKIAEDGTTAVALMAQAPGGNKGDKA